MVNTLVNQALVNLVPDLRISQDEANSDIFYHATAHYELYAFVRDIRDLLFFIRDLEVRDIITPMDRSVLEEILA